MNLRQQLIQDKVDTLVESLGFGEDEAFMRLTHSLITGQSLHAFDDADIVDGGQDKQMDLITIDDHGDQADIYILQTKYSQSFSSNALIQLHNGLDWVFQISRKQIDSLSNIALKDKIFEIRALRSNIGPSNIRVIVRFATVGSTSQLSEEFTQELDSVRSKYDNDTFESFSVEAVGYDELTEFSKLRERHTRRVDTDLKIRYDANNPSLIKYYAQGLAGLVCTVAGTEIARLVNENPDQSIFDLNIRRFLGTRGGVNSDILETCTDVARSLEFWFLNNGITIVCDKFDAVTDPDDPKVKLKNIQIVNGCQTATTLALAQQQGQILSDVRVLVRIYESTDASLVNRIVLTTNNQNKISSRDLRANDPLQLDMEKAFEMYGYYYERKPRQFDNNNIDLVKLHTNEEVAQWYLAIVLKTPSDARGRKYKVWSELHHKVFSGQRVEPYIIAALLGRKASLWLKSTGYFNNEDNIKRLVAKRGAFHIGRIAAFMWRGDDKWIAAAALGNQIKDLEKGAIDFDQIFDRAFQLLVDIIGQDKYFSDDIDRAFKSSLLDQALDKKLYKS